MCCCCIRKKSNYIIFLGIKQKERNVPRLLKNRHIMLVVIWICIYIYMYICLLIYSASWLLHDLVVVVSLLCEWILNNFWDLISESTFTTVQLLARTREFKLSKWVSSNVDLTSWVLEWIFPWLVFRFLETKRLM